MLLNQLWFILILKCFEGQTGLLKKYFIFMFIQIKILILTVVIRIEKYSYPMP